MDIAGSVIGLVSLAQAVLQTVETIRQFCKDVQELSEESHYLAFLFASIADNQESTEWDPAGTQIIISVEDLDTKITSFNTSCQGAYPPISSISLSSRFRKWMPFGNSEKLRLSKKKDRAVGTCDWIFNHDKYIKWRNTRDSSVLWISGSAGRGKSTLCSVIVDSLEADISAGEAVVWYFIDGRFKTSNTALDILRTITIKMLSQQVVEESSDSLRALLKDLDTAGEHVSVSQMREFLMRIRHNLGVGETLYLVLDGLDELEESNTAQDILQELVYQTSRCNRLHPMKLLVSSRPCFLLEKQLKTALCVNIDQEPSVRNDLVAYVNQCLQKMQLSSICLANYSVGAVQEGHCTTWEAARATSAASPFFAPIHVGQFGTAFEEAATGYDRDELSQRIADRAKGIFLWVRLVLEDLSNTNHSRKTFEELLESSSTRSCSGIYQYFIGRLSEEERSATLQTLRWVTYAARPLYLWELRDAIAAQNGLKLADTDIQRLCGGLLSTSKSGVVSLVHLSLRDYLESQSNILGWGAVSAASNEMIAHTSLQVLGSEHLLESLSKGTSDLSPSRLASERNLSFLNYALRYWRFHYTIAERQSAYLPGLLHKVLRTSLEYRSVLFGKLESGPLISNNKRQEPLNFPFIDSNITSLGLLDTSMREGARFGMVKLVRLELEMGARPHITDSYGNPPLHFAASAGHLEVMRLLLEYGADVQVASNSGRTALFYAVANGHVEAVKLLLEHGANPFDIYLGGQDVYLHTSARPTPQRLSMVVSHSNCCSNCSDLQSHYVLSKMPQNSEDYEMWPPIHVMGETLSLAEISFHRQGYSTFSRDPITSEQSTIVKWFPGIKMYKALSMAAQSGMEDVIKLLVAAGNDVKFLNRNASLNKLISNIRFS